jgi:hypothetical protein
MQKNSIEEKFQYTYLKIRITNNSFIDPLLQYIKIWYTRLKNKNLQ